ncbi:LytTR family DNA-binding domain-containing protein [Emticicia sp. W12TSBA100-4]|uniref:LytR/AlgR family response regulator transcription factor n=1 Tax=Emticicia sp. W12TSBA100-4 TaxID=3160965 RepID=UPI003305F29D
MNQEPLLHIGGRLKVAPKNIRLLKAEINYTQIYLEDGSTLLSSITLGILEKRLQDFPFFRPNRSVLINLDYVVDFEAASAQIKMENNETFKISRRRTKHFYSISNPK